MKLRRCAALFVELDEQPRFDLGAILGGGDGLDRSPRWLAHAPHLDQPAPVAPEWLAVLGRVSSSDYTEAEALARQHGKDVVDALVAAGLLLAEDDVEPSRQRRDEAARDVPWWGPALLAQNAGGWEGIDIQARYEAGMMPNSEQLVELNGPAPEHAFRRRPAGAELALPRPSGSGFDPLLRARRTCRNFDASAVLSAVDLSTMLYRVWGAQGAKQLAPGVVAVKKHVPAGGGLHAVEAYLLVQRVEGLAPGFYHYLPHQHALDPLRELSGEAAGELLYGFVGGQQWFRDVPAVVIMTARFDRLFWKYRRHAKAWRVVHLDVGHLSQTMYLSAVDLGLGAFVTAAINDRDIGRELELAPLREAAIAIVGFGPRSAERVNVELDDFEPNALTRSLG